jgi:predicted metal-dependent hydrolase
MKKSSVIQLQIKDITFDLIRKNVKNINLRITQPEAKIRVSAPNRMPVELVYAFVMFKYDWILSHKEKLSEKNNEIPVHFSDGELHYFQGRPLELKIINSTSMSEVVISGDKLELYINNGSSVEKRKLAVEAWYRRELKQHIPILIKKYEQLMNLKVNEFGVKKMKTRWGTCNPHAKRIWLNLELAKKPCECLEYVVLHEMTHFLESKHNQRFYSFVDQYMPEWKMAEKKLSLE